MTRLVVKILKYFWRSGFLPVILVWPIMALAQAQPSAFTYATRYDLNHRVTGEISPASGAVTQTPYLATRKTYDAVGRLARVEIGALAAWQSDTIPPASWTGFSVVQRIDTTYDELDHKLSDTLSANGVAVTLTQYSYDLDGRLSCTVVRMNAAAFGSAPADACTLGVQGPYGSDRIAKNVYDSLGRLTQIRRAVGTPLEQAYQTSTFSPNGQVATIADANSNLTTNIYDGFDRIYQVEFPVANGPVGQSDPNNYEQFSYDADNNTLSMRKRDGAVIQYQYDAINRQTLKIVPAAGSAPGYSVYSGYDYASRLLFARFGSAAPTSPGVTYQYDGVGRKIAETTNGVRLGFQYDADDNVTQVSWPDGLYVAYAHDGLDHVNQICANVPSDRCATLAISAPGALTGYGYDVIGRPSSLARQNVVNTTYAYDPAGPLKTLAHAFPSLANSVTFGFNYTPAVQLAGATTTNPVYDYKAGPPATVNTVADGLNRDAAIAAVGGPCAASGAGYDCNGNLTFDGTRTFTYDAENRLVGETGPVSMNLAYDPTGRLQQATVNGATTRFLYDGDALVAEYDGSGHVLRRYVHGPGVDDPVVWFEGAAMAAANVNYLIADHQGSIIATANSAGAETTTLTYDPYGVPNAWGGSRFRYTGQIELPEARLYDYKARVYDPVSGRFLQTDPVGYGPDINWYVYVQNDPVNKNDPTGEVPLETADSCSAGRCPSPQQAQANMRYLAPIIGPAAQATGNLLGMLPNPIAKVGGRALLEAGRQIEANDTPTPGGPSTPTIKPGTSGGPTAGKPFSTATKNQVRAADRSSTCVYCARPGTGTQVDHSIPRSRGGDATVENGQLACPHCNASKGVGDRPKTPPAGYVGPWPPPHWP